MAETNTTNKPVTLENLQAAAPYIATKTYVTEQISAASLGSTEFATNEEVVALFTSSSGGTS